jgi:hypothetical protein
MVLVNPWEHLPSRGDLVLEQDAVPIRQFNTTAATDQTFDLSLIPEPFFGRPDAPVVLLALNPGCGKREAHTHADPAFVMAARASLAHTLGPIPFLHLQQPASTPGGEWWRRIAKPLIATCGLETVANSVLCVQYVGYHSTRFGSPRLHLPSQAYGFELVRRAMKRGATVICMRSWRLWQRAIPELTRYAHLYKVKNVRNPVLSVANLAHGHGVLLDAMVRST